MKYVLGAALIGAIGVGYFTMKTSPVQTAGILPYNNSEIVAHGATVYVDFCASCHGEKLEGQPDWQELDEYGYRPAPPHDETGHTWHHNDDLLIRITTLGSEAVVGGGYKSYMPGFGDMLSDDDILAVLAYIKSTWPAAIIQQHNQVNLAAKAG